MITYDITIFYIQCLLMISQNDFSSVEICLSLGLTMQHFRLLVTPDMRIALKFFFLATIPSDNMVSHRPVSTSLNIRLASLTSIRGEITGSWFMINICSISIRVWIPLGSKTKGYLRIPLND